MDKDGVQRFHAMMLISPGAATFQGDLSDHFEVFCLTEVMLCVNTIVIGIETDYSRGRRLEELPKVFLQAAFPYLSLPFFLHGTCVKSISQTFSNIPSKHPSSVKQIPSVWLSLVGWIFSFCFVFVVNSPGSFSLLRHRDLIRSDLL